MKKLNMTTECRKAAEETAPEITGWGFTFLNSSELESLRIAYFYRNNPHGVKVEHCPGVDKFLVTVWNEHAKGMGCDV